MSSIERSRSTLPPLTDCIQLDTVPFVYAVQRTEDFDEWLAGLRDPVAKARILARIDSARFGNLGDCRSIGDKVSEMRVNMDLVIGCTTRFGAVLWSFCSVVGLRAHRPETLPAQNAWRGNWNKG